MSDRSEGAPASGEAGVQVELPLPFPELSGDLPVLSARMVNEYEYCPRLACREWVQGEWADSSHTVEGRHARLRVDRASVKLPPADELDDRDRFHVRSVTLSSNRHRLIAKLDLLDAEDGCATPVDYKRCKRSHAPCGAYDSERIQLCVQGLILRQHPYRCEAGVLYFVASKERIRVDFARSWRLRPEMPSMGCG